MSLQQLARAVKAYPHLQQIILENYIVGKFRLNESLIDIDLTRRVPNILHGTDYIGDGVDDTLSVLEQFGSVFTQINIDVDLPGCKEETVKKIAVAVNKYCSKASQKVSLTVRYAYYNILFQFPHATEVEFAYDYNDMDSPEIEDELELNQIFPSMQKLRVLTVRDTPLNQHFSNLLHFELVGLHRDNANDNLHTFFKANPQLRSVSAPMLCNFPYLNEVNVMLPELESLGIEYTETLYVPATGVVHFKNVKEFALNLGKLEGDITSDEYSGLRMSISTALKFGDLDSFKLTSFKLTSYVESQEAKEFLLNLITQHEQLTKLAFQSFDLSNAELMELMEQLPKLKALQVSCIESDTVAEIIRFLKVENNLNTLAIYDRTSGYRKFKASIDSTGYWQLLAPEMIDSGALLKLEKMQ